MALHALMWRNTALGRERFNIRAWRCQAGARVRALLLGYAQNLKREFPRVPLYGDGVAHFEQGSHWGHGLMDLHIGYEAVDPWPVKRTDTPDTKARAARQVPQCILKSLPEVWTYKLGNRSALDGVLDQHKERVIDLLARVARVSMQTVRIVAELKDGPR